MVVAFQLIATLPRATSELPSAFRMDIFLEDIGGRGKGWCAPRDSNPRPIGS